MTRHPDSLLDTKVVLRYLLGDDPSQSAIIKPVFTALRSGEKGALLPESVLAECVYILLEHYGVPKAEAVGHLDDILRYPGIVNRDKADLREALKLFRDNRIDFVDCILVAKSRIGDLELITFDGQLQKLKRSIT